MLTGRENQQTKTETILLSADRYPGSPPRAIDVEKAGQLRQDGNIAYSGGRLKEAIRLYSEAIVLHPSDHLAYSNRSACWLRLEQPIEALDDAAVCVKLAPGFAKGYLRKGSAESLLNRRFDAQASFTQGLLIEPMHQSLLQSMQELRSEPSGGLHATLYHVLFISPDLQMGSLFEVLEDPQRLTAAYVVQHKTELDAQFECLTQTLRVDIGLLMSSPVLRDAYDRVTFACGQLLQWAPEAVSRHLTQAHRVVQGLGLALRFGWTIHHGVAKFSANALTILATCEGAEDTLRREATRLLLGGMMQWLLDPAPEPETPPDDRDVCGCTFLSPRLSAATWLERLFERGTRPWVREECERFPSIVSLVMHLCLVVRDERAVPLGLPCLLRLPGVAQAVMESQVVLDLTTCNRDIPGKRDSGKRWQARHKHKAGVGPAMNTAGGSPNPDSPRVDTAAFAVSAPRAEILTMPGAAETSNAEKGFEVGALTTMPSNDRDSDALGYVSQRLVAPPQRLGEWLMASLGYLLIFIDDDALFAAQACSALHRLAIATPAGVARLTSGLWMGLPLLERISMLACQHRAALELLETVARKSAGARAAMCSLAGTLAGCNDVPLNVPWPHRNPEASVLLSNGISLIHRNLQADPEVSNNLGNFDVLSIFLDDFGLSSSHHSSQVLGTQNADNSLKDVSSFIMKMMCESGLSVVTFVMSTYCLMHFLKKAGLHLYAVAWRQLVIAAMLLASRLHEDEPVTSRFWNFVTSFLTHKRLIQMDSCFCKFFDTMFYIDKNTYAKWVSLVCQEDAPETLRKDISAILSSHSIATESWRPPGDFPTSPIHVGGQSIQGDIDEGSSITPDLTLDNNATFGQLSEADEHLSREHDPEHNHEHQHEHEHDGLGEPSWVECFHELLDELWISMESPADTEKSGTSQPRLPELVLLSNFDTVAGQVPVAGCLSLAAEVGAKHILQIPAVPALWNPRFADQVTTRLDTESCRQFGKPGWHSSKGSSVLLLPRSVIQRTPSTPDWAAAAWQCADAGVKAVVVVNDLPDDGPTQPAFRMGLFGSPAPPIPAFMVSGKDGELVAAALQQHSASELQATVKSWHAPGAGLASTLPNSMASTVSAEICAAPWPLVTRATQDIAQAWSLVETVHRASPSHDMALVLKTLAGRMGLPEKRVWLTRRLQRSHNGETDIDQQAEPHLAFVECDRDGDQLLQLRKQFRERTGIAAPDITGDFEVRFRDESSVGSAVMREWMDLLAQKAFLLPKNRLLVSYDNGASFLPDPAAQFTNRSWKHDFELLGRLLGLSIWHQVTVDLPLHPYICRLLLDDGLDKSGSMSEDIRELEGIDAELCKHKVRWLLENDVAALGYDMPFTDALPSSADSPQTEPTCKVLSPSTTLPGDEQENESFHNTCQNIYVELVPDGKDRVVTEANKHEYVEALLDWRLRTSLSGPVSAMLTGVKEIAPVAVLAEARRMLCPTEVHHLLAGSRHIDVDDWERNTRTVGGLTPSSKEVRWFWGTLRRWAKSNRQGRLQDLLQFATGSRRVPVGGFSQLVGFNGGKHLFTLAKGAHLTEGSLPTAHACICTVDLPPWASMEAAQQKLLAAAEVGCSRFDEGTAHSSTHDEGS